MSMGLNSLSAGNNSFASNDLGDLSMESASLQNSSGEEKLDSAFELVSGAGMFGGERNSAVQCNDLRREAMDIANIIIRNQNKAIYSEIMQYVDRKQKEEVKRETLMIRELREKVIKLMENSEDLMDSDFSSVSVTEDVLSSKKKNSDSANNSSNSQITIDNKSMTDIGPGIDDEIYGK